MAHFSDINKHHIDQCIMILTKNRTKIKLELLCGCFMLV